MPGLVTGVATVPLTIVVLELDLGITGLFGLEAAAVFANLIWSSELARRLVRDLPAARADAAAAAAALPVASSARPRSS